MDWTVPKLHDLSNLQQSVAQGACSNGGSFQPSCDVGNIADACSFGDAVGGDGACAAGSAV
jgi:hypothetical protein